LFEFAIYGVEITQVRAVSRLVPKAAMRPWNADRHEIVRIHHEPQHHQSVNCVKGGEMREKKKKREGRKRQKRKKKNMELRLKST
jgi:hypothetical protein